MSQIPYGESPLPDIGHGVEFAENPEPRVPCCLVLDVSGSMEGPPINELNRGLIDFKEELLADPLASKRVEVSIITFGGEVSSVTDFQTADNFIPQKLVASGLTPMGAAVSLAMRKIDERKQVYKSNGIAYYRPWIFLITDGDPTDDGWRDVALDAKNAQINKAFAMFCVGVQNANLENLRLFSTRDPLQLNGLRFRDMFIWLSRSMKSVSRSTPGESVGLENPAAPNGWASI